MSTDRSHNFQKLLYVVVIDSIAKSMEALHEQRGRMPGLVTIEKHASDAGDQNLFKLYLELVC